MRRFGADWKPVLRIAFCALGLHRSQASFELLRFVGFGEGLCGKHVVHWEV